MQKRLSSQAYWEGVRAGDAAILGRAITLLESKLSIDKVTARELIVKCLPFTGNAKRLGVTGPPGVGKSTFIEALGVYLLKEQKAKRIAILAIDPSGVRSGGSILGDKTRMPELSANPSVFIRPSPSGDGRGGIHDKTKEAMLLLEAAGYDIIIVETVGVGQSEIAVAALVDLFLLLALPGAGDDLQGVKRGVMELADLVVVTKDDGETHAKAALAKKDLETALHFLPPAFPDFPPRVLTCSAKEGTGIIEVWNVIADFFAYVQNNQLLNRLRTEKSILWFRNSVKDEILRRLFLSAPAKSLLEKYETAVQNETLTAYLAAQSFLDEWNNLDFVER